LQVQAGRQTAGAAVMPRPSRGKIYLLNLGKAGVDLNELAAGYRREFSLEVEVLPALPLDGTTRNPQRRQVIAEELLDRMKARYPELARDPDAALIGVTDQDMYIFTRDWDYAFNLRIEGHLAVISTARLKEGDVSPQLLAERTRKLLTKNIGILHYGLDLSNDPLSVLAVPVDASGLNRMRAHFVIGDLRYRLDRTETADAVNKSGRQEMDIGAGLLVLHPYADGRRRPDWAELSGYHTLRPRELDVDAFQTDMGMFITTRTDFYVPGRVPIVFTRTIRTMEPASRAFGIGAAHSFDWFLSSFDNMKTVELVMEDGAVKRFVRNNKGEGFDPLASFRGAYNGGNGGSPNVMGARLSWDSGVWKMTFRDGEIYKFLPCGYGHPAYYHCRMIEAPGLKLERDGRANLIRVTSPDGWVSLKYDAQDRIVRGEDSTGRAVQYAYDGGGRLAEVHTSGGRTTRYAYDDQTHLIAIQDSKDGVLIENRYEGDSVAEQKIKDAGTYRFSYSVRSSPTAVAAHSQIVRPDGTIIYFECAANGNGCRAYVDDKPGSGPRRATPLAGPDVAGEVGPQKDASSDRKGFN
jgi:YD repeat-containing protein